jgi:hypothetical protein
VSRHQECARILPHIVVVWSAFRPTGRLSSKKRNERLTQQERHGVAVEKVAENIIEDLFTELLDWPLSGLNDQVGCAHLVLTSLGVKLGIRPPTEVL